MNRYELGVVISGVLLDMIKMGRILYSLVLARCTNFEFCSVNSF